jgi:FlaA1/EpsC-like NDP-sugar epimerase
MLHLAICSGAPLLSVWAAYLLRFDLQVPPQWMPGAVYASGVCVATQVPVLWLLGWRRIGWQGISLPDLRYLLQAVAVAVAASSMVMLLSPAAGIPRSILLLQAASLAGISVMARLAVRLWRERQAARLTEASRGDAQLKRVLLYGAGFAGQALQRALQQYPELGYRAVGFVDDNEELQGAIVQGLPVVSEGGGLCSAVVRHKVEEILIAIPSASSETLQRIRTFCDQAGRPCKAIPGMAELLQRPERLTDLRHLEMADLLGRQQVALDEEAIHSKLSGRVVMVTGAAGSIGSELCRQVRRFGPREILALDIAETPLFELEQEFQEGWPDAPLRAVVGDIRQGNRMEALMRRHGVEVIFHAAAFKHVPLMESHAAMAVENNVLGTYALANAAERAGVAEMVMISTDKAVRPSSVMGASKRLAEMVVKSRAGSNTHFVSVRFGNVLGSNGSVIPTFRRQIAAGGPVTVTHPEMRRYFMTIPEASRLVLQAMAMGTDNEIFVLEMGDPVRIADLARNLIALHGLQADRDIEVRYTGLRAGEKLFEELYLSDENLVRTVHEKILVLQGPPVERRWADAAVARLRECAEDNPEELVALLQEMIPDFKPSVAGTLKGAAAKSQVPRELSGTASSGNPFPRRLMRGDDGMDAFEPA